MKKFQVLFAMLFAALTISLTSCSDDSTPTNTPVVNNIKKSVTEPNSYFPASSINNYTYTANISGSSLDVPANWKFLSDFRYFTDPNGNLLHSISFKKLEVTEGRYYYPAFYTENNLTYDTIPMFYVYPDHITTFNPKSTYDNESININSTNYNVVKVGYSYSNSRTMYWYFAKGIGIIKHELCDNSNNVLYSYTLKSCTLD